MLKGFRGLQIRSVAYTSSILSKRSFSTSVGKGTSSEPAPQKQSDPELDRLTHILGERAEQAQDDDVIADDLEALISESLHARNPNPQKISGKKGFSLDLDSSKQGSGLNVIIDEIVYDKLREVERFDGPKDEFDDVLDKKNPPKLRNWHWGLLRNLHKLGDTEYNLTVEQKEARDLLRKHRTDPDNPIYWDDQEWKQFIKLTLQKKMREAKKVGTYKALQKTWYEGIKAEQERRKAVRELKQQKRLQQQQETSADSSSSSTATASASTASITETEEGSSRGIIDNSSDKDEKDKRKVGNDDEEDEEDEESDEDEEDDEWRKLTKAEKKERWSAFKVGEGKNRLTIDILKRKSFNIDIGHQNWKKPRPIKTVQRRKCTFCKFDPTPQQVNQLTYTNVDLLLKFINERGMIISRRITHTCRRHQKRLAFTIKRARQLGLLSPISNWRVPAHFRVSNMVPRAEGIIPPRHPLAILHPVELEEASSVPDQRFLPRDDVLLGKK